MFSYFCKIRGWVFSFLLIWQGLVQEVELKSQYVMPMSMGMKMSIPYDIANLFIRPIAGVVGVAISIGLLIIIFFSIITSPFGYFFGIPSRKYVMGGPLDGHSEATPRIFQESLMDRIQKLDFLNAFFYLMDPKDSENEECQLLTICYAHEALHYLPKSMVRFYGIFSGNLIQLPPKFRKAIFEGISSTASCGKSYETCPQSGFSLIIKTLLAFLPDSIKNENFRKRKQAMYM